MAGGTDVHHSFLKFVSHLGAIAGKVSNSPTLAVKEQKNFLGERQ